MGIAADWRGHSARLAGPCPWPHPHPHPCPCLCLCALLRSAACADLRATRERLKVRRPGASQLSRQPSSSKCALTIQFRPGAAAKAARLDGPAPLGRDA